MIATFLSGGVSLVGLATLIGAVAALVTALRTNGTAKHAVAKVAEVASKVDDTHELVNGRADRQEARIEQLSDALTDVGELLPGHPPVLPPRPPLAEGDL